MRDRIRARNRHRNWWIRAPLVGLMATDPELRAAVGATRSRTRFPKRAETLAREDAAFRVWWAMHGADAAMDWLDRRAEQGAELSPEEVRFRRWLKEQER